jgi:ribosomal protein S18 acetylase RimI-like enzyme
MALVDAASDPPFEDRAGRSLGELPAATVVRTIRANWAEFYRHLGRAPVSELSAGPHLSWLLTGVPDAFLNVVFRTELTRDHSGEVVDEALRHFHSRHVARLSWWVDGARSAVGRFLASRGLSFNEGGFAMAADLRLVPDNVPSPAGLEIVPVEDRSTLAPWIQVMRAGFGLPSTADGRLLEVFKPTALELPMRTYLALLEGHPVATSQLFLGAGVAGIYNVTCLPEARGRGIGSAVTHAALVDARRQGFRVSILQASNLGYPVYRRLGFQDFGRLNAYEYRAAEV